MVQADVTVFAKTLPDAPLPANIDTPQRANGTPSFGMRSAPKYAGVIEPEYSARPWHAADKIAYTGREIFSLAFPINSIVSAGISHGLNSDPLYGTNREAFAQRVGAAGARGASQIVFSDAILATVFHEDPRYYAMGSQHRILARVVYASTRVLITHSDTGHNTINFKELLGYGGSAALTQMYYPGKSSNTQTILTTYGASLGGLAIQYELREFCRFLVRKQPK